jgi:hypothetical protein
MSLRVCLSVFVQKGQKSLSVCVEVQQDKFNTRSYRGLGTVIAVALFKRAISNITDKANDSTDEILRNKQIDGICKVY